MAWWVLYKTGKIIRLPNRALENALRTGEDLLRKPDVGLARRCDNTDGPIKELRRHYKVNKFMFDVAVEANKKERRERFDTLPKWTDATINSRKL